jgi:hypothetical protein
MSGYLYLRQASLIVGPASGGNSLDLSELHFTFNVSRATISTPQTATIRIYNLADSTVATIYALSVSAKQPDGGQVQLKVGYAGLPSLTGPPSTPNPLGLIFAGTIKQVIKGRENQTDTYIDIIAADYDQPYNYSTMNATLAAGYTQDDVASQINKTLAPYGVAPGPQIAYSKAPAARGKVLYGPTREIARSLSVNNNCSWTVSNGQIISVANGGALPGAAIQVNVASGLIGFPQQTLDGIELYTLLDPRMIPGTIIQLNNADIIDYTIPTDYTFNQPIPSIENDGFYRIYWLERQGDTRGTDWFNHIICVGATAPLPITGTYIETIG